MGNKYFSNLKKNDDLYIFINDDNTIKLYRVKVIFNIHGLLNWMIYFYNPLQQKRVISFVDGIAEVAKLDRQTESIEILISNLDKVLRVMNGLIKNLDQIGLISSLLINNYYETETPD
jgi:hypothetical protein